MGRLLLLKPLTTTKLPLAQGYDAILVVCDRFSKMAHFIAATEKTSAEGLAKLF